MKLMDAFTQLKSFNISFFTTADAAARLHVSPIHASQILARLSQSNQLVRLTRGKWAIRESVDPLSLPEILTLPWPSYVSLQTALFYHGMIDQVPQLIFAVSLGRTRIFHTPLGVYSIHQIVPEFFFGFDRIGKDGIPIASPEKALLDVLYLGTSRSRLFRKLPEIEFPSKFSKRKAYEMIRKIPSKMRRTVVERRLTAILSCH